MNPTAQSGETGLEGFRLPFAAKKKSYTYWCEGGENMGRTVADEGVREFTWSLGALQEGYDNVTSTTCAPFTLLPLLRSELN